MKLESEHAFFTFQANFDVGDNAASPVPKDGGAEEKEEKDQEEKEDDKTSHFKTVRISSFESDEILPRENEETQGCNE